MGSASIYLRGLSRPAFRALMRLQGVADYASVPSGELDAYVGLLKREDGGRAFLRIMRGFERTEAKRIRYRRVLAAADADYPVQIIWGADDPALPLATHGGAARAAAGAASIHRLPGKHFLQEDNAAAIATHVARIAER